MASKLLRVLIGFCLLSSFAPARTGADNFLIAQQKGLAKNPSGLTFTIRLKDGKSQFQQGEIIRVELSFSSKSLTKYQLDGATYDRSGRLETDSYHVDPADGAVDPLKDRYEVFVVGGGGRNMPILEAKPYRIVRDLNEYLRFDKPGKYRLYIKSSRIEDVSKKPSVYLTATSNIIEFTITPPDKKWAGEQFLSAKKILESKDHLDPMHRDEAIRSAYRAIRFLVTEDSMRYMLQHIEDADINFGLGLIGSPFRPKVVKEMEDGLDAPECVVSSWYLSVLSNCSYAQNHPHRAPFPDKEDKVKIEQWQEELKKELSARNAIKKVYVKRLAAAIPNKKGPAKIESIKTLLNETTNWQNEMRSSLPANFLEKITTELIQMFFDLKQPLDQAWLLASQWEWIKSPDMTTILERYYQNLLQGNSRINSSAAGIALQRIFEIAPKRGRDLIMKEIVNPTGRIHYSWLSLLPDKTLPEMDDTFIRAMENNSIGNREQLSTQVHLLSRYGTSAILEPVKVAFHNQTWPTSCEFQGPVIAYFLRVDPAYGAAELDQAMSPSSRVHAGCSTSLLWSLAQHYTGPELESAAIRRLDDPDPEAVADAVETLHDYGSVQAETPLWKRFEKWHDEWKEKTAELQSNEVERKSDQVKGGPLDQSFSRTLAESPAWFTGVEKLKRIQSHCLTSQGRELTNYFLSQADVPRKRLYLRSYGDKGYLWAAQYNIDGSLDAAKAKLAQFPKGTVFLWSAPNPGQAEEQEKALIKDLKLFLEERGMIIEERPSSASHSIPLCFHCQNLLRPVVAPIPTALD